MLELQQQEPLDYTPTHPVLFILSASLAEQTIATYNQTSGNLTPPPPTPLPPSLYRNPVVPNQFVPETGKQHPFNPELNYVVRYPLGFRGCYV